MSDLIDRQAAIDFVDAGHLCNPNEPRWSDNEVINFLKSRPSAQPTQFNTSNALKTLDCIDRQAAIDAFMTATGDGDKADWCRWVLEQLPAAQPKGFHVVDPVKLNDIYRVICAQREVAWRIYQSNKKRDPSGSYTLRMFHEWLTLDSTARLFTDPVELETIKEIYHLNEED